MIRFRPHVHAYFRTHTSNIGVAQWLACWAHNPKVPRSKRGFDTQRDIFCEFLSNADSTYFHRKRQGVPSLNQVTL